MPHVMPTSARNPLAGSSQGVTLRTSVLASSAGYRRIRIRASASLWACLLGAVRSITRVRMAACAAVISAPHRTISIASACPPKTQAHGACGAARITNAASASARRSTSADYSSDALCARRPSVRTIYLRRL